MTNTANASTPVPTESAPPSVAGADEILDLLVKFSKDRVLELTFSDGFPEPTEELGSGDVWLLDEVEAWIKEHGDVVTEVFKPTTPVELRQSYDRGRARDTEANPPT
jgi:prophage regulatory protein